MLSIMRVKDGIQMAYIVFSERGKNVQVYGKFRNYKDAKVRYNDVLDTILNPSVDDIPAGRYATRNG